MESFKFSDQQEYAIKLLKEWFSSPEQNFYLGGYAGTGKTFLASKLGEILGLDNLHFCAFTGKAVDVLKSKGIASAATIHSMIYQFRGEHVFIDEDTGEEKSVMVFKDNNLDWSDLSLLVVDEFSMLDNKLMFDLKKRFDKILWMGDPAQLPPVFGTNSIKPEYTLTDIQRQAADNEIIQIAHKIRQGIEIPAGLKLRDFESLHATQFSYDRLFDYDQVLVATNRKKAQINNYMLEQLFPNVELPFADTKLVVLANNSEHEVFNGMPCTGVSLDEDNCASFLTAHGNIVTGTICKDTLVTQNKGKFATQNDIHISYAYALTTHKSQGSEYDKVCVFTEGLWGEKDFQQRWLYTAITRAREKVTLVC